MIWVFIGVGEIEKLLISIVGLGWLNVAGQASQGAHLWRSMTGFLGIYQSGKVQSGIGDFIREVTRTADSGLLPLPVDPVDLLI